MNEVTKEMAMDNWNTLVQKSLQLSVPPVLVRVVSQQGSAPRTAGARMLVREHDILGTVGGGQYEGRAIALSRQLQADYAAGGTIKAGIMRFSLYGVEDMDMVCGGELCLLFELLVPGEIAHAVNDTTNDTTNSMTRCAAVSGATIGEVFAKAAQAENEYKDFCLLSMFGPLVDVPALSKPKEATPKGGNASREELVTPTTNAHENQDVAAFLRALPQGEFVPVWVDTVFCASSSLSSCDEAVQELETAQEREAAGQAGELKIIGAKYPLLFDCLDGTACGPVCELACESACKSVREPGFVTLNVLHTTQAALVEAAGAPSFPYCFADPFPAPHVVHIFGGGHVSKALADCLAALSFGIVVLEDRAEFITKERFPLAKTVGLPSLDYESCKAYLSDASPKAHHAIVIMTRGHAYDRDVLAASLESAAGYLGMIGSKRKWGEVQKQLVASGVSQTMLDAVHTPIGLSIGAETPEEIGVSIAAELIAWRRGVSGSHPS